MLINISELLSTTSKVLNKEVPIEMENYHHEGIAYTFAEKSPVVITVSNIGERAIHLDGHFHVALNIPCDRCLEDVKTNFDIEICRDIDLKSDGDEKVEKLDEFSFIEGSNLDIEKLVYNELLMDFPMKTLCSENCKGICPKCGKNLNQGECGCDRASLDPRMSAVLDIFNNFKEV